MVGIVGRRHSAVFRGVFKELALPLIAQSRGPGSSHRYNHIMRFVLVGPAYPFRGGIAQYTTSLYQVLSIEHEVLLLSFTRQYPDFLFPGRTQRDESGQPLEVPQEAILDSLNPSSWRQVARRVQSFSPDVVIFQWWQPFFAFAYRKIIREIKNKGGPLVFFLCHNIYAHESLRIPGQEGIQRFLARKAFRLADGFLVQAETLIAELRRFNSNAPVRRIYHPVYDFYVRWDSGNTQPSNSDRKPRLLFFGKIRKYKGLGTFLEALGRLKEKMDFEAVIAGEFYLNSDEFKRMALRLGVAGRIVWKDRYVANEEVPALFRGSDLVVLPYTQATQSGVVPVAYQFGVPVIASRVGGLAEVIRDGETGYLVPPNDPDALADKIYLYLTEGHRETFQENIRDFCKKLTWQQVVDNILSLVSDCRKLSEDGEA